MSKGPDLSAFPIPRKGNAKPLATDEPSRPAKPQPEPKPEPEIAEVPRPAPKRQPEAPVSSGQIVATTLKLDESRYLRLAEAGKPGPGRLKRRSLQDMLIEALDEWFDRRGL